MYKLQFLHLWEAAWYSIHVFTDYTRTVSSELLERFLFLVFPIFFVSLYRAHD